MAWNRIFRTMQMEFDLSFLKVILVISQQVSTQHSTGKRTILLGN